MSIYYSRVAAVVSCVRGYCYLKKNATTQIQIRLRPGFAMVVFSQAGLALYCDTPGNIKQWSVWTTVASAVSYVSMQQGALT